MSRYYFIKVNLINGLINRELQYIFCLMIKSNQLMLNFERDFHNILKLVLLHIICTFVAFQFN